MRAQDRNAHPVEVRPRKNWPCPCGCGTIGFCEPHRERLQRVRKAMLSDVRRDAARMKRKPAVRGVVW